MIEESSMVSRLSMVSRQSSLPVESEPQIEQALRKQNTQEEKSLYKKSKEHLLFKVPFSTNNTDSQQDAKPVSIKNNLLKANLIHKIVESYEDDSSLSSQDSQRLRNIQLWTYFKSHHN